MLQPIARPVEDIPQLLLTPLGVRDRHVIEHPLDTLCLAVLLVNFSGSARQRVNGGNVIILEVHPDCRHKLAMRGFKLRNDYHNQCLVPELCPELPRLAGFSRVYACGGKPWHRAGRRARPALLFFIAAPLGSRSAPKSGACVCYLFESASAMHSLPTDCARPR